MNILYTNFHYNKGGGHTTYILSLMDHPGYTSFVACPATSHLYQSLQERGFNRLLPLTFPTGFHRIGTMFKEALALRKFINRNEIDIVHTNGSPDNLTAFYASLLPGRKFHIVFTKHNTYKIKSAISRWRLTKVNSAVIGVSQKLFEVLELPPSPNFHAIDNCVDVNYWQRGTPVSSGEKLVLISNAGLRRSKGWRYLAQAVAALPEEAKSRFSIVLLGRENPKIAGDLEELRGKCALRLTGFMEDCRPELEKADVGFVLSHRESCSFACREMMSMSLPVITSDYPCLAANVDKSCGWVTGVGQVEKIKQVLLEILAMPPERLSAMKLAARQKAEKEFALENMRRETYRVYCGLV